MLTPKFARCERSMVTKMVDGFIKVAAATPKIKVADTAYNAHEITNMILEADSAGAKIIVLPELCKLFV